MTEYNTSEDGNFRVASSSSEDIKYRITETHGCPTCGNDTAIEGSENIKGVNGKPPVCRNCGEVLSHDVVEEIEE